MPSTSRARSSAAIRSISSIPGRASSRRNGRRSCKMALAEAGEHLSLYQLTIEPETPFAALHAAGKLRLPDEDTARALYDTTQEICAAHGLPAYEISNHARPGRRMPAQSRLLARPRICRHRSGRPWPARHRRRTACHRDRKAPGNLAWPRRDAGHGVITDDVLTREERSDEFLLMGLRLAEGIDIARYEEVSGRTLDPARIATLLEHGLVEDDGGRLAAGHPARLSGARRGGRRPRRLEAVYI